MLSNFIDHLFHEYQSTFGRFNESNLIYALDIQEKFIRD